MAGELDDMAETDEFDEDLDAADFEDLEEDAELEDEDLDAEELADDEEDEDLVDLDDAAEPRGAVAVVEEADEEDEEVDDEDVEASLDEILKERLVVEEDDDEEEDEAPETDDRSEIAVRVLPKQPDEFVCSSCFLVKHPSQLADAERQLCRDCV